ncbi:hypothetical protein [Tardiphaga sp. 862_B3_N1_1]|uniref:hypothetical protein n=1 Tax=Tardiphaga sp. 862_B3_N1_1 TaxID=3240763 RepID=UPI003F8C9372
MSTIIPGSAATIPVNVQQDGAPVPVSGELKARVFSMDGRTEYVPEKLVDESAPGAAWAAGLVVVSLTGAETTLIPPGDAMLVLSGPFGVRRFRLIAEALVEGTRTSLFVRDIVVDEIRRDRLMAATAGILQGISVSDAYLWDKVRAAESEIAHTLRVPLVPTRYFPIQPTAAELAALDGMAWDIDVGYDYEPEMFERDKWGYIVTRQRPIISVEYMRFAYPTQDQGFFDVPVDWLRVDSRPGHIRIVPSSSAVLMGTAGFAMTTLINRRNIPAMVQLAYTAGLKNAIADYPELLDIIKKKAVLKIIGDAYLPQSGSISADGLSESMSVDMTKYSDFIDEAINGPKGSNGGLMTAIHGIRQMVF